MAISLTADPIVATADLALVMPNISNADQRNFLINAASDAFLRFTGRTRITSGATEHYEALPPMSVPVLYLRATPIDTGEDVTLTVYNGNDVEAILASDDYTLQASNGRLYLSAYRSVGGDYGRRLKCEYTGGWTTVPGDVQAGAMELIRIIKERLDGRAGVASTSFEGMSTSFETGNLPTSVKDAWQRYRIY